jgi:hypothetical protein
MRHVKTRLQVRLKARSEAENHNFCAKKTNNAPEDWVTQHLAANASCF